MDLTTRHYKLVGSDIGCLNTDVRMPDGIIESKTKFNLDASGNITWPASIGVKNTLKPVKNKWLEPHPELEVCPRRFIYDDEGSKYVQRFYKICRPVPATVTLINDPTFTENFEASNRGVYCVYCFYDQLFALRNKVCMAEEAEVAMKVELELLEQERLAEEKRKAEREAAKALKEVERKRKALKKH
jgi:hypothetical protein